MLKCYCPINVPLTYKRKVFAKLLMLPSLSKWINVTLNMCIIDFRQQIINRPKWLNFGGPAETKFGIEFAGYWKHHHR